MAEDAASLSRRIDELLSGAIDEQVREQRAINELMVSVRDGISRLVGDMAALSARVTESREASQGLREELPFLVQNEVTAATNTLAQRIDVLETAIGELAGSQSQLEEKLSPDVVVSGVAAKVAELRTASDEAAGSAAVDAAREAVSNASAQMRGAFEEASAGIREALDKQFAQIARRLADAKTQADELDDRVGELVSALGVTARLPGDVADTVGRLTSTVESQTASAVRQVQQAAADATEMLQQTVGGIERAANDMNKRFSEMSTRMASFQEQVLAYLQVRDVALEEKRDQIVSEILDEYLSSLPPKERGSTIGKIREAFRRRRDRKDAARYRDGSAGALRLPEVPRQAVDRAVGDLVRESRESRESAARRSSEPAAYEESDYRAPPLREPSPEHPAFREPSFREPSFREPSPRPEPPEPAPPQPARPEPDPLPRVSARPVAVSEADAGSAGAEPSAGAPGVESAAESKPKRAAKGSKAAPKRASRSSKKVQDPGVAVARSAEPAPPDVLDLSEVDVLAESEGPLETVAPTGAEAAMGAEGAGTEEPDSKPKAKRTARAKKKEAEPEVVQAASDPGETVAPEPGEALSALAAEPDELAAAEEWEPVSVDPVPEAEEADLTAPTDRAVDEAADPGPEPAGGGSRSSSASGDDTLAEALARVEALVAQHRDPSRRKPPARKTKKDDE